MPHSHSASQGLMQGLGNRHIQLIGLGGSIGTGLFLGAAGVLQLAGPAMLLAFAGAGLLVFLIMRMLGEMLVEEPVSHSYSYFAHRYWGRFAGFFAGWNTIALYVLVGMLELSAAGHFVQFWWPAFPTWATAAIGLVLINGLNLINVRMYGEAEFWFALIKVVAVIGMIGFGAYVLVAHYGQPGVGVSNLWAYGGFAPNGFAGVVMALGVVAFSYGGLETMGFAAAETRDVRRVMPRAINQILVRIAIFYLGSSFVLLTVMPWPELLRHMQAGGGTYASSPFALVFSVLGDHLVANVLNLIVLTAALSVYNSMVYSVSRMLYGMAQQGNAPGFVARVNRHGVPVQSIGLGALVTGVCVLINYLAPGRVVEVLISLVTATLVLIWAVIICTHFKFRAALRRNGVGPLFPAPFAPWSNLLCLGFIGLVIAVLYVAPSTRPSAYAIPVWIAVVYLGFRLREQLRGRVLPAG